jgi:hypothetical protein
MIQKDTVDDAFKEAMVLLEKIFKTSPDVIANNMNSKWPLNRFRKLANTTPSDEITIAAAPANEENSDEPKIEQEIDPLTLVNEKKADDDELPAAVIRINGSKIIDVKTSGPMRVIILDQNIYGADENNVNTVNGERVYVNYYAFHKRAAPELDGINPYYIEKITEQL